MRRAVGRPLTDATRSVAVQSYPGCSEVESAPLAKVKNRTPYPVSLMPQGLLNAMNPDEVLNLLAYVQSGGNPNNPAFRR